MAKSKRSGLLGSVDQAASLAKGVYEAGIALPNQHDNDAQMFSDFAKQFSAPNDRPRGIARNIGAGFFTGLAAGSRSKGTEERQQKLGKYQRDMDYLQKINQETIKQNQWYERRENARNEMMPQVLAYMDNIDKLDPQSQRIMAQDMLAQYGEAIGENFKLSSIDGSNPFLMTIQSDKGQQLFDLRSLFAGDEAMQQSIAMKMPEYQKKLQEERENKAKEFQLKQDALDIKKFEKGIPGGQFGTQSESQGNHFGSIPIKALGGKGITPFMQTINSEINLAKDIPVIMHQMDEAEKIIGSNPQLGSWWANVAGKSDFIKGIGLTEKTRADYEKVDKIASRIAEAYIRAKQGAISDSERETIKQGLFKVSNSAEGNKYNINSIRQELKIAKERGDFAAQQLKDGYIATSGSFDEYMKSKGVQGNSNPPAQDAQDEIWDQVGKLIQ